VSKTRIAPDTASLSQTGGGTIIELHWRCPLVQHARILKRLSRPDFAYNAMRPIAMTVAALLMLIGVFGLIAILW
jgi:hypothetical protein